MKLPKRAYWAVVYTTDRKWLPSLCSTKFRAAHLATIYNGTIHRVRLVAVGAGEKGKAVRRG